MERKGEGGDEGYRIELSEGGGGSPAAWGPLSPRAGAAGVRSQHMPYPPHPPAVTLKQAVKDEGEAHSACYISNQSYLHLGYFYLSKLCSHSPENCDLLSKLQALKATFLQGVRS